MLLPDWKKILLDAWSSRLMILSMAFALLGEILPQLSDIIPPGLFRILSIISVAGGLVMRVISQKDFRDAGQ